MTPRIIIDDFRAEAHDVADPPLWSDTFLLRALNEGRLQAARRARLLEDGVTAEVCKISVKTPKLTYDVDKRVIYIRRVKHSLIDRPLPKLSVPDADAFNPGWESMAISEPCAWVPWGNHQIRLVPPPNLDATVTMIVVREPLEDVTIDSDEDAMDLDPRYHYALKDWMMFRAYMQRDLIEKYRPEEARQREEMFDREFGPPMTALQEAWIHRKHGYDEYEGLL